MHQAELDPAAILHALGIDHATQIEPVAGGWDTAIWRVEAGGVRYALRVFRPEQLEASRREVCAMRAAAAGGVAVPEVHAQGIWHSRPAMLLSWRPGRTLTQHLAAQPWRIWALGTAFGRQQARIHAIGAPDAFLQTSDEQTSDDWMTWAGPIDVALRARLRGLAPKTPSLLHLDYHPLNVLATSKGLTAVLDWTNAHAGDARADVARTYTILRLMPLPPSPAALLLQSLRRVFAAAWQRGYAQSAGRLTETEMAPFYAWAGAVMVQDLAPKLGRSDNWLRPDHLERIKLWSEQWRRRAGL